MQKLFILLFLGLTFAFVSCGSDDEDITGTYKIVEFITSNCDDPEENLSIKLDDDGCVEEDGIEICIVGTFTIGENGVFSAAFTFSFLGFSESTSNTGTYTYENGKITICSDSDCTTTSVNFSGGKMTISIPDDETSCTVMMIGKKQ